MKRLLLSLGAVLMVSSVDAAGPAIPNLDRELAAIVNDSAHPLASLSVLALRDGKIVYQQQFGQRWIDGDNPASSKPATPETMYRIASISKLVTTLGVMRLVESGKLALDADASDYLGFKLRNPHFPDDPITLRMLLSHTSSLRDDGGYYWEAKLGVDLKDVLVPGGKLHGKGEMWATNAKPGAYFQYANLPWGVIGTIMERASGERFDRLMKRLVLDPMGLHGGFHPADFSPTDLDNTATLYRKRIEKDGKEIWNPSGPWVVQVDDYRKEAPVPRALPAYVIGSNGTLFGPQGNCRLSAIDLAKVMLLLINQGQHEGKTILKRESVGQMLSTQWRHDSKALNGNSNGEIGFGTHRDLMNQWGLGVQHFLDLSGPGRGDRLVEGGGFKALGHLGDAWGLTSAMVFDPKTKDGMIFLIGGPGFDPETNPGSYSSLYRHEEKILTALYRYAIKAADR
jgi:CubicO group peptidase (beta-lactamase class C family)